MYRLPQAVIIANKLLTERLAKYKYNNCEIISFMWKHNMNPVIFCLMVYDFGVKYVWK